MAVNNTQTKTRSTTSAPRAAKAPATPPVPARRPRPGQALPLRTLPAPIARTKPRAWASAAEVVTAYLKVHVAELRSLEPKVRADEFDSVHQMRVATRTLRATLRASGKVIRRARTEKAAADLKCLGGLLGEARDAEVLSKHLHDSLEPLPVELLIGPVQARVQGYFAPRRASGREELIKAFDSVRYAKLLVDLDMLAHDPPLGPQAGAPARDVLPAAVSKAYRQASKRMRRGSPEAARKSQKAEAAGQAGARRPGPGRRPARGPQVGPARPLRGRGRQPGDWPQGPHLRQADEKGPVRHR